jgi:hypothetical protein
MRNFIRGVREIKQQNIPSHENLMDMPHTNNGTLGHDTLVW